MKNNLKQLLDDRGLTQKDLSRMTGICEAAISRYINGTALMDKYLILLVIADALRVKVDDILIREDPS